MSDHAERERAASAVAEAALGNKGKDKGAAHHCGAPDKIVEMSNMNL